MLSIWLAALAAAGADPASHWAFQPVRPPNPAPAANRRIASGMIDRLVIERLERAGGTLSPAASPRILIRRMTFDLTGLPPEPAEVDAFLLAAARDRDAAVAALVDRLLDSPHYGERWARWWLDVARYADSNGQDENKVMGNAWRYRDWVVRSFNRNKPFDHFITEQLAGDLLPPTGEEQEGLDRLMATGFLVLGPKMLAEQDKPKLLLDIIDEQIDTVGRAFLGLTLGCARCHDHKFDPVPARDYYAMAGIFKSTRTMEDLAFVSKFNERPVATRHDLESLALHQRRLAEVTNRIAALGRDSTPSTASSSPRREELAMLEASRAALVAAAPPPSAKALAVEEAPPATLPVMLRGNHLAPGPDPVPRGFLRVLNVPGGPESIPTNHSGRLELARWLTSPNHPLTSRVAVNRVWQAHFGRGLVPTADNFGLRGEPPTDPELLDWMAQEFIRSGWDLKALHRLILTSRVYQQSSATRDAPLLEQDPENRLLGRFPRQRLEAEMVRDALLAVSGRLDRTLGGALVQWPNNEYVPGGEEIFASSLRRTLYLPIVRDRVFDGLTLFDFANPSVCSARRVSTVVSHQALFFLNSPLVASSADALARVLLARADLDDPARVNDAHLRLLARPAGGTEIRRGLEFLSRLEGDPELTRESTARRHELAWSAYLQGLLASNEFLYRD